MACKDLHHLAFSYLSYVISNSVPPTLVFFLFLEHAKWKLSYTHTHSSPDFLKIGFFSYCLAVYISSISGIQSYFSLMLHGWSIPCEFLLSSSWDSGTKSKPNLEYAKNSWQREDNKQVDTIQLQSSEFLGADSRLLVLKFYRSKPITMTSLLLMW